MAASVILKPTLSLNQPTINLSWTHILGIQSNLQETSSREVVAYIIIKNHHKCVAPAVSSRRGYKLVQMTSTFLLLAG